MCHLLQISRLRKASFGCTYVYFQPCNNERKEYKKNLKIIRPPPRPPPQHRYSIHCPSWTVIRQICEIFDDFFVFHCATLLCFIIVIYVIIVKCEVMTSLNTLCYVPLLLCVNSNPYTCEDSSRFARFLTTFFVFQLGPVEMCTFNFHHKFQKQLFVITIQAIGIRV